MDNIISEYKLFFSCFYKNVRDDSMGYRQNVDRQTSNGQKIDVTKIRQVKLSKKKDR